MKHPNIIRSVILTIIGISIGFIAELVLTFLFSLANKSLIGPKVYFIASILSLSIVSVILLYLYLKVVRKYPYKYNYRYLTSFLLFDVSIVLGGFIGKGIL
ncbi:MAG: hypothetical protein M3005_02630 [Apilactobacillus sp.]|uniref:hypothetical protein n=1 Tax=Apilactobacillus TaxID=2767877 RepID=UPI0025F00041|nr:hypothetical protein [Apilactobacillus sp.]MCT6822748.1 hypothetical protein [Apilactobacillus sp.]MCT6858214.1 hypothetical protein [Apilactobacillus sp.]